MKWLRGLRVHPLLWLSAIALFAAALLIGLVIWHTTAAARDLAAARQRWATRPFLHYRMVLRRQGWGSCQQDVEVYNEQVVKITSNTCRRDNPRSVSDLFAEIERYLRPPEAGMYCRNGLAWHGCACYIPYTVTNVYNSRLGYPETIKVSWGAYAPNRWHIDYWHYLVANWREPACGGPLEPPGKHLVVFELKPLP